MAHLSEIQKYFRPSGSRKIRAGMTRAEIARIAKRYRRTLNRQPVIGYADALALLEAYVAGLSPSASGEALEAAPGATPPEYDKHNHLLLCEVAHLSRIDYETAEYEEFVARVRREAPGADIFLVRLPDWPPVIRQELALIMSISVDGMAAAPRTPFADKPFCGVVEAVRGVRPWQNKEIRAIARQMAPLDSYLDPHRMAYQWQIPVYDPDKHVLVRAWCAANRIGVVRFLRDFVLHMEAAERGPVVDYVVNPSVREEKERTGQYCPEAEAIDRRHMSALRDYFLVAEDRYASPSAQTSSRPRPDLRTVRIRRDDIVCDVSPYAGSEVYSPADVEEALCRAIGRPYRLFGGRTADNKTIGITRAAAERFLSSDATSDGLYVPDTGRRHYDCDDFAINLRSALCRHYGINAVGVVWGDVHAWNFIVLAGSDGPEIMFVEPQTDAPVAELAGQYSVRRRCEIYM